MCRHLILLVLLLLAACESESPAECKTQGCLVQQAAASPTRSLDFWQTRLALPLSDRIGNIPDELVTYIDLDNRINGFPAGIARSDDSAAKAILQQAVAELPLPVRILIRDKLAGIFLVKNLGSSGYTEHIYDSNGNLAAGVVVIDVSLFTQSGNDWASSKDATAFNPDPDFEIRNTIADPNQDTPLEAVRYLLIHELGHIVSIGENFHPSWDEALEDVDLSVYPFASLSWKIDKLPNRYVSHFDGAFILRDRLVYYRRPQLEAWQMPDVIEQLKQTNFVSLYASTRPEEDFAESFAVYVHSEMMGKPFKIELMVDGQVVNQLGPCFKDRCRKKYDLLKRLFDT